MCHLGRKNEFKQSGIMVNWEVLKAGSLLLKYSVVAIGRN